MKLGLLKEGKTPPDKRVALTPEQCSKLKHAFPGTEIFVQKSPIRAIPDEAYASEGMEVTDDLSHCDVLLGVKEVQIGDLIPNKTYLFFSHTVKKQAHNRELLKAILANQIRLIDYELLKDQSGKRLLGFGRFAGIVGCYNAFYTYGLKSGRYVLKRAKDCVNREEMEGELKKVNLPDHFKMVLSGYGKVGHGAREIIKLVPIQEVTAEDFHPKTHNKPVFVHLDTHQYYRSRLTGVFDKKDFYQNPQQYDAYLVDYVKHADVYAACHFWANGAPSLLRQTDLKNCPQLQVIADISCDVGGPIAATLKASTISDPIFGYDAESHSETDWQRESSIAVMSIDNLPCELPIESSEDFGKQLLNNVFYHLLVEDKEGIIEAATQTTLDGRLADRYSFLKDYVEG